MDQEKSDKWDNVVKKMNAHGRSVALKECAKNDPRSESATESETI